jgi:hypothetical protein
MWLLVAVGTSAGMAGPPTQVVERFATVQECTRVRDAIAEATAMRGPTLRCVEATVARERPGYVR